MKTFPFPPFHAGPRALLSGLVVLALSGCTPHLWMAGPGQTAQNFEPTKAHCQLLAQGGETGFSASGSPSFVAGAALGHAIGDAIRVSSAFNACMRESGFVPQTREVMAAVQSKTGQINSASAERKECISAVRQNPGFAILAPHFADLTTGHYSMEQLADQTFAKPIEIETLPSYFDGVSECRARYVASVSPLVAGSGDVLISGEQRFQANALALIHHQISWGNFSLNQQAIQTDLLAQLKRLSLL